jgi:hypothetical protein
MCFAKFAGWQLAHVVTFMVASCAGVAGGTP